MVSRSQSYYRLLLGKEQESRPAKKKKKKKKKSAGERGWKECAASKRISPHHPKDSGFFAIVFLYVGTMDFFSYRILYLWLVLIALKLISRITSPLEGKPSPGSLPWPLWAALGTSPLPEFFLSSTDLTRPRTLSLTGLCISLGQKTHLTRLRMPLA